MGAITPIGNSVEEFWNGIKEGKTGFGPITYFDTADYRCKLAAEVKDFDPAQYMDKKSARRMEQFCQFAVAAAGQAISDAGLTMEQEDPYMVGCSVGSGIGSLQAMEREYDRLKEKGPGRVGPMLVPLMISNMAAGNVSIAYGLKGKSLNVVTACATGTHSIGEAYRTIQYGDADVMIAGGTESSITPIGIAGFSALTALSFSEDPHGHLFLLTRRETASSWEKVRRSWYWKSWSMQRGAGEDLCGTDRLRLFFGCLSYYLPCGGWQRSSHRHAECLKRRRGGTGGAYLY